MNRSIDTVLFIIGSFRRRGLCSTKIPVSSIQHLVMSRWNSVVYRRDLRVFLYSEECNGNSLNHCCCYQTTSISMSRRNSAAPQNCQIDPMEWNGVWHSPCFVIYVDVWLQLSRILRFCPHNLEWWSDENAGFTFHIPLLTRATLLMVI